MVGCSIAVLTNAQSSSVKASDLNSSKSTAYITTQQGIFKSIYVSDKDIYISSSHISSISGIHHYYHQQTLDGVDIHKAVASVHIDQHNDVAHATNNLIEGPVTKQTKKNSISVEDAISIAAEHFKMPKVALTQVIKRPTGGSQRALYENSSITRRPMPTQLVYLQEKGTLSLHWKIVMDLVDRHEQWAVFVNAIDGVVTQKEAMFLACSFGPGDADDSCHNTDHNDQQNRMATTFNLKHESLSSMPTNAYKVYQIPLQAPHEGSRSVVIEPWLDAIQNGLNPSPFGWHDIDGIAGADTTVTIGNNVIAFEDLDGNDNTVGVSPDGGAMLSFDFALDTSLSPGTYTDAATVNLFYLNNIMHDVSYLYGFDEVSGNFQTNNYNKGGLANDALRAECQDGFSTNNAFFFPTVDGSAPMMEMFEWSRSVGGVDLEVSAPASVAGSYEAVRASFGADIANLSGSIVLADPIDGCTPLTNASAISGQIALIDRGGCLFKTKAKEAQDAGAIAVIICDNVPNQEPFAMGGVDPSITIPAMMVSYNDCQTIRVEANNGLSANIAFAANTDSDLDNGIIAHEYAHGISIRLTGGASNISCLDNEEQMGEGWSDYYGLMLQLKAGDLSTDLASMGTYVLGQTPSGNGIRRYPYTTDMNINPFTYDSLYTGLSEHGVGSVWCTMLWDMTWALIDKHGFEPNIYNGTGGNGIALKLVMEGLKLQPCSPGFVDGRDAILLADRLMFAGQNQCEIWQAFAQRGLGYSADQGSSSSILDGVEAFDLPPSCPFSPCDDDILSYTNMTIPDGTDGQALISIDITNSNIEAADIVRMTALQSVDISSLEVSMTAQLEIDILPCDSTVTNLLQPRVKK